MKIYTPRYVEVSSGIGIFAYLCMARKGSMVYTTWCEDLNQYVAIKKSFRDNARRAFRRLEKE